MRRDDQIRTEMMYLQPCSFSLALPTAPLPIPHVRVWQVNIDLRPPHVSRRIVYFRKTRLHEGGAVLIAF